MSERFKVTKSEDSNAFPNYGATTGLEPADIHGKQAGESDGKHQGSSVEGTIDRKANAMAQQMPCKKCVAPPSSGGSGEIDADTLSKLEAAFATLEGTESESLLKKHLTRDIFDSIKMRLTSHGSSLMDVIQSGVANPDSGVGIYAPDAEAYSVFKELFDPVIDDYHKGFKPSDRHPTPSWGDTNQLVDLDPENKYIKSTRVRCGRSIQGFPFNPRMTEENYVEMEKMMAGILNGLSGEYQGEYLPLTGMSKETQQQLIDDHFLFVEGDRFLQAANSCRYWPKGRGIFLNQNKTFLVWVGEEDHLRIISMQEGGNLREVYERLVRGVQMIEQNVKFSLDQRFGYLTFCPTNLGTTLRASVMILLPSVGAELPKLEAVAETYNLQVRGSSGEHTASTDGRYDISNKRRLGLTEFDAVMEMQGGVQKMIAQDKEAGGG